MACIPSFSSATLKATPSLSPTFPFPNKLSSLSFPSSGCYFRKVSKLHYPFIASNVGNASISPTTSEEEQLQLFEPPASLNDVAEGGEPTEKDDDIAEESMDNICDKLIDLFLVDKPKPSDWRKLIVFSKSWNDLRSHYFQRCQDRADNEENPEMKHNLHRLARKVKEIDDDVQRHNELLDLVRGAPSEIEKVVARRRKDFTNEFFTHVGMVASSYYDQPEEKNDVIEIAKLCAGALRAYDKAFETIESMNAAELKFQDIVNSPSINAACRKIDMLAEKNQLDSFVAMRLAKAWSTAQESSVTKDEVKYMMYKMYMHAVRSVQSRLPKVTKILRCLLFIEDPEEKLSAMRNAFTPGEELVTEDGEHLYTTPEKLHKLISELLTAYHNNQHKGLLHHERELLRPTTVQELVKLKKMVQDHFL